MVLEGSENVAVRESKWPNGARRLGKCRGWGIQAAEWCSKARKMSRLGNQSGRMMLEGLENVVVGESKRPNGAPIPIKILFALNIPLCYNEKN
jgi:hypothetical protein